MTSEPSGDQRLDRAHLEQWQQLSYGMFIHFGMSTFDGRELSPGDAPSSCYAPDRLDVDQWAAVAADAGMRYAVLTAKHVAGHCLWPTDTTDYHVGTSGTTTDVVEAFVSACQRHGIGAGLYYCSWDNRHPLGSQMPGFGVDEPMTSPAYRDFQAAQVEELLTRYGPLCEVWIDMPALLGWEGRRAQYEQVAELAPDAVVVMNHGLGRGQGDVLDVEAAWPTDVLTIECDTPPSHHGYEPWFDITDPDGRAGRYYLPGEACDTLGRTWFWTPGFRPRSDAELLGMRLLAAERGTSFLLDVPPDSHGVIPPDAVAALQRLAENFETMTR